VDEANESESGEPLSDAELKTRALECYRVLQDSNERNQAFLSKQMGRVEHVVAADPHESVALAAARVSSWIESIQSETKSLARNLATCISAVEKAPSLLEAIRSFKDPRDQGTLGDLITRPEPRVKDEADLIAAVDALEFAAATDRSEELKDAIGAMGDIIKGVTRLQVLGFEIGEIQATVDDFIGQKKKRGAQDFSLLAPTIRTADAKGTKRNKKVEANKRRDLLEQDKWLRKFLHDFWYKYWRNAFERSLPDEREVTVEWVREKIPDVLASEDGPQDVEDLLFHFWRSIRDLENSSPSRVRLRDEHVVAALERLVAIGHVVEIEGDQPKYWTRHRAEQAGLKVAPPRLALVPDDDHSAEE
jgi:hypothetical protein